jgi:diguanylate cyclase (GGDEF)-like protein/PAS domain S-box-containing protein
LTKNVNKTRWMPKLWTKVVLSVALVQIPLFVLATFLYIQEVRNDYLETIGWHSLTISQQLQKRAADLSGYTPKMQRMLGLNVDSEYLLNKNVEEGVVHVGVTDLEGNIIASADSWRLGKIEFENRVKNIDDGPTPLTFIASNSYITLIPVYNAGRPSPVAIIYIGFSQQAVDIKITNTIKYAGVLYFVFLLLSSILISILLRRFVTQPISELSKVAANLANGNLSVPVPKAYSYEVGLLAASFENMSHSITEKLASMKESEDRFRTVSRLSNDILWEWHIDEGIVNWFGNIDEQLCYEENEIPRNLDGWKKIIHPEDIDHVEKSLNISLEELAPWYEEYRAVTKGGEIQYWVDRGEIRTDIDGRPLMMIGAITDITKRKLAEDKLILAASVFTHARESIAITDAAGTIIDINDTFMASTGYSREESIGQNSRFLKSGRQPPDFYADMWKALVDEGCWYGEVWNRRKSGEVYAEMKTISAIRDARGIITHYVGLGTDITQKKSYQDQLERIAHYDVLTNLPNRALLSDRLSQAMLQCRRRKQSLAVVFLDLDHFKEINDTHGHDVGDELLIALSVRMKEALREGDTLARIGGDEFVAVLADLVDVEDCEPVLNRLLVAASEPVIVGDLVLKVSASLGVTLYPQDSVDTDQLLRHADQAMYAAKQAGKNRYYLFDTVQNEAVNVQREKLEAIRSALDDHQFVLHYQPKVNMRTGAVVGVEALIRWQHPERGLLNPIDFLPAIEHSPMMIEMGEWVIDTALTQISQWQEMGLNLPVSTSVNIAAVQIQQHDFTDRLTTLLAAHPDVDPRYLELEILETSAIENVGNVSTVMNACMAMGIKFSLDDFGTGYSSLTYFRHLPASQIKIDQSFVRNMLHDPDDLAIVEGVIALAKSFKREVIAEGVETIEHGTALLQLGCDLAQGYGIARPMPAGDIPAWVDNWKPDDAWRAGIVAL